MKYCYFYPEHPFASIEEAREWVARFVGWYNTEHYHSGLKFVTPAQRHNGEATLQLAKRQQVYQRAQQQHPERWSGKLRNWDLPEKVILNPNNNTRQKERNTKEKILMAA